MIKKQQLRKRGKENFPEVNMDPPSRLNPKVRHRNTKTEVAFYPSNVTDGSFEQTESFAMGLMPRVNQSFNDQDVQIRCERSIRQIHEELKHYLDEQLESKLTRFSRSIDERSQALHLFRSETHSCHQRASAELSPESCSRDCSRNSNTCPLRNPILR